MVFFSIEPAPRRFACLRLRWVARRVSNSVTVPASIRLFNGPAGLTGKSTMKALQRFFHQHAKALPAFWALLIILFEASIALYILRNL